MIASSGSIKYRRLKEGGYQLLENTWVQTDITGCAARISHLLELSQDGVLTLHKGYRWDGCSGPAIDRRANMRAGLFHDGLYQLCRSGKLPAAEFRIHADRLFKQLYLDDGGYRLLAAIDYAGLRWFAGYAARRQLEVEVEVLSAP